MATPDVPERAGEAAEGAPPVGSVLARRQRWLTWAAVVVAALCLAVLGLSTLVRSPAQVAAETEAPERTVLTAVVERRLLEDTVVLRGTVVQTRPVEIRPAAVFDAERMVVTGVRVKAGQRLAAGAVVAEVSGRPVVVLPGAFPAYRDIRPGARGKDVAQLQAALRSLGYRVAESVFGPSTKAALTRLYESLGYPVPTTGEADAQAVRAARAQVTAAERALRQGRAAATSAPGTSDVADAKQALAQAKADLAALVARTGPMLPMGEVAFVPRFPARVTKVNAVVGQEVTETLAVLAVGDVVAVGTLAGADPQGVVADLPVQIGAGEGGEALSGKVVAVGAPAAAMAAAPGGPAESGDSSGGAVPSGYAVAVSGAPPLDAALVGQTVRLSIVVSSSAQPVLVVPVAAVSAAADSLVTVTVVAGTGEQRTVPVTVGRTGDGYVEVSAPAGQLQPGDRVVVGQR
ncbi:peptidoglycan-binding protein [Micromonospora sp. CPCC 206061]|uniref:peptidoglycan-binding protein n=1 Tax=Micromonospora sp. CPCC 206061 TaxID=3122410 RepID=UPI002FF32FBC